ncbi:hypothetical protein [Actinomycetospora straminea]|uniref:Uncharacterized protein n=1 Tax=Actinomycetospora straminea TaxID=663607 RepID=A0ABP9F8M5_9PSEU|nr:hypothetical protein [Actinomycetospora straminea]MDD7934771.1 hypothetical protein [Actinomycetospora straminea]
MVREHMLFYGIAVAIFIVGLVSLGVVVGDVLSSALSSPPADDAS